MLEGTGTKRLALKVKLFGTPHVCSVQVRVLLAGVWGMGMGGGSRCVVVCIPHFRGIPSKL